MSNFSKQLPATDPTCLNLAAYLQEGLNAALEKILPGKVAVRDICCYDAVNPDLSRFPLLKIYRTTDTFNPRNEHLTRSILACSYCLTFPDQDALPGVLRWVAVELARLLGEFRLKNCPPRLLDSELKFEYRIMVNEVSQPVYAFLRSSFQISDF